MHSEVEDITVDALESAGLLADIGDEGGRRARLDPLAHAAAHLGVDPASVFVAGAGLDSVDVVLVGRTIGRIGDAVGCALGPARPDAPPRWALLDIRPDQELVPVDCAIAVPAGELSPVPAVVRMVDDEFSSSLQVVVSRDHAAHARELLKWLMAEARGPANPYRGQCLAAESSGAGRWHLTPIDPPEDRRSQVHLPAGMWQTLERNVVGVLRDADRLVRSGLGANRGILLAGPPGTGKTAACRAIAAEAADVATVVLVDAAVAASSLGEVYDHLTDLAPVLAVIEDLDLVAGRRWSPGGNGLHDFLVALDGMRTRRSGVVTLASANDPRALDAAAGRAGRLDLVLNVPLPDEPARRAILATALAGVEHDVDTAVVALRCSGSTGADIHEVVRRAVIEHGEPVSTADLCRYTPGRLDPPATPYL